MRRTLVLPLLLAGLALAQDPSQEPPEKKVQITIHSATVALERFAPEPTTPTTCYVESSAVREGDLIRCGPPGRVDVVFFNGTVIQLRDTGQLFLRQLDASQLRLALLDGHRTDVSLKEVPTIIELPPFNAIEGSDAVLQIHHDFAYRQIRIQLMSGGPIKIFCMGREETSIGPGQYARIPWLKTLDEHRWPDAKWGGSGRNRGGYFRVRRRGTIEEDVDHRYDNWKDVMVPDGVLGNADQDGRRVTFQADPDLKLPAVATIGRRFFRIGPGGKLTVDLTR